MKWYLNMRRVRETECGPTLSMDFLSEDGKHLKVTSGRLGEYPREVHQVADDLENMAKVLRKESKHWDEYARVKDSLDALPVIPTPIGREVE